MHVEIEAEYNYLDHLSLSNSGRERRLIFANVNEKYSIRGVAGKRSRKHERPIENGNGIDDLTASKSRCKTTGRGVFQGKLQTCPREQSWRMRATMGENPWHSKLPVATPEDLPRICDGLAILGDTVHCETRSSSPRVCS